MKKQKRVLTWIGKAERPRLEQRILLEDQALSCHAGHRVTVHDCFDYRLIFGDNLLVIPHDKIAANMTLDGLTQAHGELRGCCNSSVG